MELVMTKIELSKSERLVLEIIRRSQISTRIEIAKILGFSTVQATKLTKGLLEKKLILENVTPSGARGQPTKNISLNPDGLYAIGVSFTAEHIEIGLVNWLGIIKSNTTVKLKKMHSLEALCHSIEEFVENAIKNHRLAKRKLCGIGISLPGDFLKGRRKINAVYFPEMEDVDLLDAFSSRLHYPVFFENDATSATWGEFVAGAGRKLNHFLFIHIGHGIGGGVIIDRRIYRGTNGNAGAFGAPFPDLSKARPSGTDLLKHLQEAGEKTNDFVDLRTLTIEGCAPLETWINNASQQLIKPLTVLARAFDPDAVIIGGRLPIHLLEAIAKGVNTEAFCQADRNRLPVPDILVTELGDLGGVIGAASLCLENIVFADKTI